MWPEFMPLADMAQWYEQYQQAALPGMAFDSGQQQQAQQWVEAPPKTPEPQHQSQMRQMVGADGRIDPVAFAEAMEGKVKDSPLNGYVPKDGAAFGIKEGSPREWARLFSMMVQQESGHKTARRNPDGSLQRFASTIPTERSFGPGQFNIGEYGLKSWDDVNDPSRVGDAMINVARQHVLPSGAIRGPNNTGLAAYFGSIRRPHETLQHGRWYDQNVGSRLGAGTPQAAQQVETTMNPEELVMPGTAVQQGAQEQPAPPTRPVPQVPPLGQSAAAPQTVDPGQVQQVTGMRQAPPGTPPEAIQSAWKGFLSDPRTQGMMMAAAIEMMKPRWTPGSAIPDALSAGIRAGGAYDENLQTQQETQRVEGVKSREKQLDRDALMDRTEASIAGREDVANIRARSALEGIELRSRIREAKMTQNEQFKFSSAVARAKDQLVAENILSQNPLSEQQMENLAQQRVFERLQLWADPGRKSPGGAGMGGPNAGGNISGNPAPGAGRRGRQGAGELPSAALGANGRTTDSPPPAQTPTAPKKSLADVKRAMDAAMPGQFDEMLKDPAGIAALKKRVSNPASVDAMVRGRQLYRE